MTDVKVTAYLAEVEQREQAAIRGPWTLETERDWDEEGTWEFPYGITMPEAHTERADREHRDFDYLYSELSEMGMPTARFLVAARSDIPRLIAAVRAGLDFHRPFGIYDECDHDHADEDVAAGAAVEAGLYLACKDSLMYQVCTECCTVGMEQTEECVTHHDHGPGKPWCRTYQAMAAELLGGVPADV